MRKNKMMRLASTLLVLTMMTTCAISGTFAKYTSQATASDTARVAKWSFTVNDKDIAKSEPITFDLFATVADVYGDTDDAEVANDKIIAPGTGGKFQIDLHNASEVDATYTIDLSATATIIPIEYSLIGTDVATDWTANIGDLTTASLTNIAIDMDDGVADNGTDEASKTVYWRWCFDPTACSLHGSRTDVDDTNLGVAAVGADQNIKITATITATQVD